MAEYRVLFVCHGNICRSPMAEAVFTHIVKDKKLEQQFEIDSAGTSGEHRGDSPDPRSAAECRRHGVAVNHRARQVTKEDFHHYTHILCMDRANLRNLKAKAPPGSTAEVRLLGEFDPQGELIIEDPYYGGPAGFEHNFRQ
ncbi:hypothetical protein BZG36_05457, partial [Bifiguratus adelaidae]